MSTEQHSRPKGSASAGIGVGEGGGAASLDPKRPLVHD